MPIASVFKTSQAVLAGLLILTPIAATEPTTARHELRVGSYVWGETSDVSYPYGVVPFVGRPLPNEPVDQGVDLRGTYRDHLLLAYRYRLSGHWRIQLGFSQATLRFTGAQPEYVSRFEYQFYQYWDGTWAEATEVAQTYRNARQPRAELDLQMFSVGIHYAHSVGKLELGLAAGVDCILSRNGTMDDLFFASSQIGSRSIRFDSVGYLHAAIEDTQRWGTSIEVSLSYPMVQRLLLFVSARMQWLEHESSRVRLLAGEPGIENGMETWYLYDAEDLQSRVDLQPFKGPDSSLSLGIGLRLEW